MSPRAASRFESLGFAKVYDYLPGKMDWFAAGLPREGKSASSPRVVDALGTDTVTCKLDDPLSDVTTRVRTANSDVAIVTSAEGVVLGRVRGVALEGDLSELVEAVMDPGPTTIRPNDDLNETIALLRSKSVGSILVTDSNGVLLGTLYVDEAERFRDAYGEGEESCCCCDV